MGRASVADPPVVPICSCRSQTRGLALVLVLSLVLALVLVVALVDFVLGVTSGPLAYGRGSCGPLKPRTSPAA